MKHTRKNKQSRTRGWQYADSSCRNHGDCAYCASGRQHKFKRDTSTLELLLLVQDRILSQGDTDGD